MEDDGSKMRVRAALSRINEVLDEVLAEQEGDFDPDTRFAIAWFRQYAGHRPGVGQRDAGDDVAVIVLVVIAAVANRVCLNCSRSTPVAVGSSLSVSGILSRPGTT